MLSAELKAALGIQENVVTPPPWLINMQRYGLPPSYPNLRIPGLNAPLPPGATYGYHPGGWGKPPVDEYGRPLYGDVFGTAVDDSLGLTEAAQVSDSIIIIIITLVYRTIALELGYRQEEEVWSPGGAGRGGAAGGGRSRGGGGGGARGGHRGREEGQQVGPLRPQRCGDPQHSRRHPVCHIRAGHPRHYRPAKADRDGHARIFLLWWGR